ncbi:Arc family DNA-binding protein [Ligilactobacillus salivarius]|uniref:Arc-like DNA binding domain-containing protein n=2 Tax=Ligilactobacillus salivarius TaxID=1624 RepID=V6DHY1_9LACO|nr:Arc family DNA-binding protein [Ligilactobacillus salivarius]CDK34280.1 hypothetical protein LSCP400_00771 [Ligilactobacillus salivarius cp400]MBE7387009.1 Arc family DNA-binding protein [Ligilactobacillus salivarius]MBE7391325.1 Arc family DNA-binding protein [Ligilactobacillus salivarius]MCF2622648.1 Arc family DNA-binding protein [Ligilactobacillus salivarius]MCI6063630.1 Arc family DNA-binding protein [Ligilactobacillus salivarius]
MVDKFTNDNDKRFTLRIDKELFDIVSKSAKKNKRSTNKEIEFVLQQYFNDNTNRKG